MNLEDTRAEIEAHLSDIATLFVPGVKLTFLMRQPNNDEGYLLITNDSIDDITSAVERSRDREETSRASAE